ncbi:protein PLANT CADMIUM RESISTANCE 2 isoform X1 [Eucalyptus grandis]|uniref:protein PLANT CADMIUM RESISTANCE 2 isoform X1 n=1 Tax=Eucalyptus grandis TaxID=71139 RepID=UPI00192EB4F6|nr:protein PLANT CADMIUM RESISTANCE 2 isoform X1 [Eucalyptus grandis]
MYSSNASDGYPQKPGASAPPPPPPMDGIPVQPMNQSYANFGAPNNPLPPAGLQARPINNMPWSSGLFSCFDDVPTCCLSFWCPCITFGQIAFARIEEGSTLLDLLTRIGFCCSMPCARSYLHSDRLVDRVRLLLLLLLPHQDETAIPAARESLRRLLSPFLLRICALTQEYCELEKCGFDMSIGRHKSPPFDQPARNDVPLEMPISRTI